MTYEQIIPIAKKGNIIKLPNWDGYFKWNYEFNNLEFVVLKINNNFYKQ